MTLKDPKIAAAFAAFPEPSRAGLLALRGLIFDIAARTPEAGKVEEALRWGQPAYLTPETKSGSTLRLGIPKQGGFALYAHCQSRIIPTFRDIVGTSFQFEGNRAVLFRNGQEFDAEMLSLMVHHALTYHLKKR